MAIVQLIFRGVRCSLRKGAGKPEGGCGVMTVDEEKEKLCFCDGVFHWNCHADECMAWRWHEEFITDHQCETFLNEDSRLEYKPRSVLSKTSGYCGLCGKEGAE